MVKPKEYVVNALIKETNYYNYTITDISGVVIVRAFSPRDATSLAYEYFNNQTPELCNRCIKLGAIEINELRKRVIKTQ